MEQSCDILFRGVQRRVLRTQQQRSRHQLFQHGYGLFVCIGSAVYSRISSNSTHLHSPVCLSYYICPGELRIGMNTGAYGVGPLHTGLHEFSKNRKFSLVFILFRDRNFAWNQTFSSNHCTGPVNPFGNTRREAIFEPKDRQCIMVKHGAERQTW